MVGYKLLINETVHIKRSFFYFFPFFRATLYVGKYSTSLYASPSLVHDGVTVVVSGR